MSERSIEQALQSVPVDGEAEARAWEVVRSAYAEREPMRRRPSLRWPALAAATACAIVAAALSPPGGALVDAVRRTIGIEHAAPALFRLPAPGRLLVSGGGGTWLVASDGSKRRLGDWVQAAWSPHGLFVVAAGRDELAALDPHDATLHWSLARPRLSFPRWGGSRTDTRIAYLTGRRLHVVAGDGTGDRVEAGLPNAARMAPAWRPGNGHVLAYVTARGRVVVFNPDEGAVAWVSRPYPKPRTLVWSPEGRTLVLATAEELVLLDARTGAARTLALAGVRAAAFSRRGRLAVLRGGTVLVVEGGRARRLLAVPGRLAGLAWSPDGRWILTTLPLADQWIFVSGRRVLAVSHIARQLGGEPSLDGWLPDA